MSEIFYDSDIKTNGKIIVASVPNNPGTVVTYNTSNQTLSTRTNIEFIEDLGLTTETQLGNFINKSTDNIVKDDTWYITSDASPYDGKFTFSNTYPVVSWGNSRVVFTDEGAIEFQNYGIRQDDGNSSNAIFSDTYFKNVYFQNPQGTIPFNVESNTLIPKLNADLLDGKHASDFLLPSQLDNYISKTPLQFRALTDANNAVGVDFFYLNGANKPSGSTDGPLLNMTYDNSLFNSQLYVDWRTNEWYGRTKINGNWGNWQKFYNEGNLNIGSFVPQSRTITINGTTQDLSLDRAWTTPNTVTRLRGGASFVSGDITITSGANVTVSQAGQVITIAATDTNTTYTAGNGLTLSGTVFSLPLTSIGSGNAVSAVSQTSNGISVTYGDYMTTSHVANSITTTNINNWNTAYSQTHTHANLVNLNSINQNMSTTDTVTFESVESRAFVNTVNPSPDMLLAANGDLININTLPTANNYQSRLVADGQFQYIGVDAKFHLSVFVYDTGTAENTRIILPQNSKVGQEVLLINTSGFNAAVSVANNLTNLIGLANGYLMRLYFVLDGSGVSVGDYGPGKWVTSFTAEPVFTL